MIDDTKNSRDLLNEDRRNREIEREIHFIFRFIKTNKKNLILVSLKCRFQYRETEENIYVLKYYVFIEKALINFLFTL